MVKIVVELISRLITPRQQWRGFFYLQIRHRQDLCCYTIDELRSQVELEGLSP